MTCKCSNCSELLTIISEIDYPFPLSSSDFYYVAYHDGILYVPSYSLDLYKTTEGWKEFKKILPIEFSVGKTITLSITDSRNQDISNQVSVLWYDTNAKQIGSGNSLNGIEEGDTVYYSVQLNEDLGRKYKEVIMQQVVVDSDTESLTCTLNEIPRIELAGRVSATDIDKNPVTVTVKQMLNGKYEQMYSTQTDEQGQFKIEVYDDVTDITLGGEVYFDATLHRDGFAGNGNVGTIPMNLLSGFAIAANITLKKAKTAEAAEDITEFSGGLNNIEFSLYNATKGKELSDFTIQNGNLIIKSDASIGDEIRLMAKSKQGIFAETTTTFTIEEGANSFALELTELGGIDVTYAASSNGKTIGYLYDANNALVAKGSYVGDNLSLRHLPSGNYTLVTMGNSALLGNLTRLSDLNSIGLNEGSDYITTSIAVTDGALSASSINEVPRLDDSRFYYTSNNAYFSANKATVTVGNYIALSVHMDLKPQYQDKVDDVLVTVELPEGCQLVENSVIANRQIVAHTYSSNKLMMNLSQDQWQGEIRFCVIPVLNQTYAITAMASFDIDGGVSQPIGTAQFESKGLSLNTPSRTVETNITINGTAKGKSDISIYDDDVLIGKTTSKADGTWTANCELYKTFSHSYHNIYAKITDENGLELTSETKQVEYDKNMIVPKSVTMTFYNGWYKENKTVRFNLIEGTTTPNSYPFYSAADFTFLADFTKNDNTLIKNVNIKVLNSDGTVRTLPATFDDKQGKWVATTKYSSSRKLPQNVTVEYDYIPQEESDDWREESILDQATVLANCANQIQKFFEDKEATVIEDEDDHLTIEYMYDETTPVRMRIENMDFSDAERMMKEVQFIYAKTDEGIIGTYTEEKNNEVSVVAVDIEQMCAFKMSMTNPTYQARRKVQRRANWNWAGTGATLAGYLLDFTNITPYLNVRSDFDNMSNLIVRYTDNYNTIRNRVMQKLLAKCPDGSNKIESTVQLEFFYVDLKSISAKEDIFSRRYYEYLNEYQRCLGFSMVTDAITFGLGKYLGERIQGSELVKGWAERASEILRRKLDNYTHIDNLRSLISFPLGAISSTLVNGVTDIFDYQNFDKVRDNMLSYAYTQNYDILKQYNELSNKIENAYKKCSKDDNKEEQNDEPSDDKSDNKPNFPGSGSTGIIDPSGYVYEAVLSNRLEGVTATCYQQVQNEDMYGDITDEAVIWNAEDYSQQNPVKTDKDGFYRWDVPQGMWQVKYEKEGYETVYSGWLPVPPPQLDVNIAMKQSTPPAVKQMRGTESGITIDLTKYMLPATMNATNITVNRNGKAEQGTIEMLNAEQAPLSGETYVQKVKFIPNTRFNVSDNVVVTVHKAVESYCGVPMTADHQETVEIESEITDIVVDASVVVPYQGEREVRVLVLPKEASAGRTLHAKSSSSMIASVSASDFVIEEDGSATITISGELPGGAMFDFEVDGTDVTATSKIQVKNMGNEVMVPTASIPSGGSVAKGTKVELSCDTEGATIYYTLDGSCPCDEEHRILYTEPITITENVTISAIAVVTGMYDSDVAEFKYIVDGTNIDAISFDDNISLYPLPMKDKLNVKVNEKKIEQVTVTNTEGVAMVQSKGKSNIVSLDVHSLPSGIYVISVSAGGKTYTRKVIK